ncbi:MAG: putative dehydrogenase [Akkermansiaceae bacterium]|jgi:predicted dehydrogenase
MFSGHSGNDLIADRSMKTPRLGILGSGFIVNDCHLPAYRKIGLQPVAIASRTPENARKVATAHGIETVHDSLADLLNDSSLDVLDIAVPPQHQPALIRTACARGTVKGILAQKPLALDYAEALSIVAACEKAGIVLAVNQNMRFDPAIAEVSRLLKTNRLGDPVFTTIEMRGIPHWQPWQEELQCATLKIMSIHHLDCIRHWHGDPEAIYCSTRPDPRTKFSHHDGICTSILEYSDGFRAVIIDDVWTGPAHEGCPSDIDIVFRIEGSEGLAIGNIGWCQDPYTTPSTLRHAAIGDEAFIQSDLHGSWFPDAFGGTMTDLLTALRENRPPTLNGRDNLKTIALMEAAVISSQEKRRVLLDEIHPPTPHSK